MWGIWRRWRSPNPPHPDDEIGEEIRDHLRRRSADLVARGLTPDAAARQAAIEFGGVENYRQQARQVARGSAVFIFFEQLWLEVTRAAGRLVRTPVFTIFAILSIAVSVGITTAVYAFVVDPLEPSGARSPDDLMLLAARGSVRPVLTPISLRDFDAVRRTGLFRDIAAVASLNEPLSAGDVTNSVRVEVVSGNYFQIAGIVSVRGRLLSEADDAPSAANAAVIGERYWRDRLGASESVVGSTERLGGVSFLIVGIVPDAFGGLQSARVLPTSVWVPFRKSALLGLDPYGTGAGSPARVVVMGRSEGRTKTDLATAFNQLGRQLDSRSTPSTPRPVQPRNWTAISAADLQESIGTSSILSIIAVICVFVVMAAATSVANLTLARDLSRASERFVRRSLGASWVRLGAELVFESCLITLTSAAGGLWVAAGLMNVANRSVTVFKRTLYFAPHFSRDVLIVFAAETVAAFLVFGVVPAVRLARGELAAAARPQPSRPHIRRSLVAFQVAVCSSLFLVGAMLIRGFEQARFHDAGVDFSKLTVAVVGYRGVDGQKLLGHQAEEDQILHAILSHPEFDSAAVVNALPFEFHADTELELEPAGTPFQGRDARNQAVLVCGTPDLFRAFDISILAGRPFDERDLPGVRPSVILDERMARRLFGQPNRALGQEVNLQGVFGPAEDRTWSGTVVGVAEDTDASAIMSRELSVVYLPRDQVRTGYGVFVARSQKASGVTVGWLQRAIRNVTPDADVLGNAAGWESMLGDYRVAPYMAELSDGLGLAVLLLSVCGLYGVLSELVQQRRQEMGLRLALGAEPHRIVRSIVKEGMEPVAYGLVIGLLTAMVARRLLLDRPVAIASLADPLTILLASVPLLAAAFLACYLPARRASKIDPTIVLRAE